MQDATIDHWDSPRECATSPVPRTALPSSTAAREIESEILSLRALNRRFLDLECTAVRLNGRFALLSAAQKDTVASCPYALFDIRLHDAAHWQARLRAAGVAGVAESRAAPPATRAGSADVAVTDFLRLALFFVWHVASAASTGMLRLAPPLGLGMHASTTAAFARTPVSAIPDLAQSAVGCLSARWPECDRYWSALVAAAERADQSRLHRVRLYGIQLAAAVQLPLRAEPREV